MRGSLDIESARSRGHTIQMGVDRATHPRATYTIGAATAFIATANLFFPGAPVPGFLQPTFISLLLVSFAAIHFWVQRRLAIGYPQIVLLAVACASIPGALAAGENEYAQSKPARILLMIGIGWCVGEAVRSGQAREGFLAALLMIAALLALALIVRGDISQFNGRRTVGGMNPIGIGRTLGYGVVVALFFGWQSQSRRYAWWILAMAIAAAMITTGSRGPALAAIIGAIGASILFSEGRRSKWRAIGMAAFAAIAAGFLLSRESGILMERVTTTGDASRPLLWKISWEAFLESPLGIGFGNLHSVLPVSLSFGSGYEQYSHNFILEALLEGGVVFGLELMLSVTISLARLMRARGGPHTVVIGALLIASLVNATFSSDLTGNRFMWAMIGVSLFYSEIYTSRKASARTIRNCASPAVDDGAFPRGNAR